MRSGVRAAVVLLVSLPMLVYVLGRLAVAPPDPAPRSPVILERSATPSTTSTPGPQTPSQSPSGDRDGDEDDAEDDDGVRVVKPSPTRVGEDDGEREPEGDDRTDDDTDDGGD